jgi:DNA-directed RNA polymerase subunit RPC12/RpoP
MTTYVYKCWKCNKGPRVEQDDDAPELDLECRKCGRKLFRCNIVPGIQTDSTFMSGSHVDDGFGDDNFNRMKARRVAKAAGVNPEGKRYCPSLAKTRNDPEAWVDGKADVTRVCKKNGWGCRGSVNVQAQENDQPNPLDEPYSVDPKLVEKEIRQREREAGEKLPAQERADLTDKLATEFAGAQ